MVDGQVTIDGRDIGAGLMAVACADKPLCLEAVAESHVMVIGGAHMGKRHIWWNFVSTSRERMEQAKQDWREGRFGKIPGETEFIPLPSD